MDAGRQVDVVVCGRGVPTADSPLLGIFELDQARALQAAGLRVVYAALDVRSLRRWRRWGLRRCVVGGVPTVVLNAPLGRLPVRPKERLMAPLWDHLLRAVVAAHGRPRVLHGHFLPWTAPLACRSVLAEVPLVVTEHWSRLSGQVGGEVRVLGEMAYPRSAAVLAVSSPLAQVVEREFGVPVAVVPNIVDVDLFGAAAGAPRGRALRLVSTGNLIARKGMDALLAAFADVAPADAELTIIGGGDQRAALEAQAASLGVGGRVHFTGRLDRAAMVEVYARATGFALASRAESFGVVWAEALAAGLPVLATRCGGPEDFVDDGNGVLVDPTDAGLRAGLAELCDGIARGRWSSQAVADGVRAGFSGDAVAGRLMEVYDRL